GGGRIFRDDSSEHGNPMLLEEIAGLVLIQVHGVHSSQHRQRATGRTRPRGRPCERSQRIASPARVVAGKPQVRAASRSRPVCPDTAASVAGSSRGGCYGASSGHRYDERVSRLSRSMVQRMRVSIVVSVGAIGLLFIVLRLLGMRSTVAGFAISVGITLALNDGLSHYNDYRPRSLSLRTVPAVGGDIRWRE